MLNSKGHCSHRGKADARSDGGACLVGNRKEEKEKVAFVACTYLQCCSGWAAGSKPTG